jgi:endonuclease/exonuclease/phosphatase family metal-dependent hydrolase
MTTNGKLKRFRFGTWNVQTLYQAGRLSQVCKIMERYELMFLGLSEVRWNECGELVTNGGHLMVWSGMPNQNDPHQYGVGILINKLIRNSIISYKFISERILLLRIRCKVRNLTVVQCYAPTEDAEEEVKQAFYDMLQKTLTETPKKDMKVLMGDFNAKVGSDNDTIENVMGKHGLGEMNENGELLVEACGMNELRIGGTLFPHKECHKVTWVSPDSRTQNQIDHICVSAKWSNKLQDVRNKRGADIGSDHHLLMGVLCLNTSYVSKTRTHARKKFETAKLNSDAKKEAFSDTLRSKLAENAENVDNIQQKWCHFKNAINETCVSELGYIKNRRQDFISPQTWSLIERREMLKNVINSAQNSMERRNARERYKALDKHVKRMIRDDKREQLNTLAKRAEDAAAVYNMRDLYNITRKISNTARSTNVPVKDRDGVLLTNVEEQLTRWKEHFMEVLNLQRDGIEVTETRNTRSLNIRTAPPTRTEIRNAIKALKNGKAAGIDNITAEVLKVDVELVADTLKPLFEEIWEQESFPEDWLEGIIVKLPKKGDLTDCNNWRGINILCVTMKVFCWIILNRIVGPLDKLLRPEQAGFRAGRSCIDQINTLRIIIEQSVEFRSPLYLLFVDYEKAFDSISRECIWAEMQNIGVPNKIISLIRSSYDGFKCRVIHNNNLSDPFPTVSGVRQGCLLSPLLFLVVMDAVAKRATLNKPRGIVWNPLNPLERLESLDYADDKCELSHRCGDMQLKIDDLANESAKVGLKINVSKTKEMRVNPETSRPMTLNGQPVERVSEFLYLGSVMAEDGGAVKDVYTRIKKARGAFIQLNRIWSSTVYSNMTKMNIFKACVVSVLLYGCETWLVTEHIKNKIQVFVNRCLRRIFRIFWPRKMRNERLWQLANMKEVNMQVRKRKFGWIGHTLRKDPSEIPHRALVYNPQGSRKRGRPKNSWRRSTLAEANMAEAGQNYGSLWDLRDLAARRTRWRNFIEGLCSS